MFHLYQFSCPLLFYYYYNGIVCHFVLQYYLFFVFGDMGHKLRDRLSMFVTAAVPMVLNVIYIIHQLL